VELNPRLVSLKLVATSVLTMTRHQAEARNISLNVEIDDDADCLEADEQLLKQILINLLSNAFKFTDLGGQVRLSATAVAGDPRPYLGRGQWGRHHAGGSRHGLRAVCVQWTE